MAMLRCDEDTGCILLGNRLTGTKHTTSLLWECGKEYWWSYSGLADQ
jgi:hypothetical protein